MAIALKVCRSIASRGYYAYVVLFAATLGVLSASVGHSFMFAPYNEHVRIELGLSHTYLASIWLITLLAAAGWVNVTGRLVDRCGPGIVVFLGSLLEGASMVVFGFAEGPLTIGFVYFLARLASVETCDFVCRYCVNLWWSRKRGFAVGVLHAVSGFMLLLPAGETLVISYIGWRATAIRVGVVAGLLLAFLSTFLLSKPENYGLEPDVPASRDTAHALHCADGNSEEVAPGSSTSSIQNEDDQSYSFREAIRTPFLWVVIGVSLGQGIPWTGINFLLSAVLLEAGYKQSDAAYVYITFAIFSSACALAVGCLIDRIPKGRKHFSLILVSVACAAALLTAALLSQMPGTFGSLLLGCVLGVWCGTNNVVSTTVVPNTFGRRELGAITGLQIGFATVSSASGPTVIAIFKDFGLHFRKSFLVLASFQVIGIVLVLAIKPPAPSRRLSPVISMIENS